MMDAELQEILMDNYVRVPKPLRRLRTRIKTSEYLCLEVIWEKTGGWNKTHDHISISQFTDPDNGTGLSERTVQTSIKSLAKRGLITIKGGYNNIQEFSINMAEIITFLDASNANLEPSQAPQKTAQGVQKTTQAPQVFPQAPQITASSPAEFAPTIDTNTKESIHKNITKDTKGVSDENESLDKPESKTQLANSLIDYWNENHGKGEAGNVKSSVWVDTVKSRLKKFTADEIKLAMQYVIDSPWHNQNREVLIKNAIDSDKRCDKAVTKAKQVAVKAPAIDRKTDRLAVNENWVNASQPTEIKSTVTFEEAMGDM